MEFQGRAIEDRRHGERHAINPEFAALEPGTLTYVSNLSEYGVFITTAERVPVGTNVDLRFTVLLDDPVVIHGPGRVVHHQNDPSGMGVMFTKLSAEMQLRVIDAINWYRARGTDSIFRTRELTADELAQIAAEDEADDEAAEADEATSSMADADANTASLSSADLIDDDSASGLSASGLSASAIPSDDEDAESSRPQPAPQPTALRPPADDEYEDF